MLCVSFFFFKQKTAYEMRISDWSSDVCSSDLPSDLLILAGRPGMGKTSLATNIAFNAARRWMRDMEDGIAPEKSVGAKVAFFSLEMSADQLATRILAEQSRRSEEHTSELQSLMRISYAVFCLKKNTHQLPAII